jgi:hypothetical protein
MAQSDDELSSIKDDWGGELEKKNSTISRFCLGERDLQPAKFYADKALFIAMTAYGPENDAARMYNLIMNEILTHRED